MSSLLERAGTALGRYLSRDIHDHGVAPPTPSRELVQALMPGDVLLVEGHSRFSTAIKYLTQSTWSHAALYVGTHLQDHGNKSGHCFVEADLLEGVRSVGPTAFARYHTRICRPMLDEADRRAVTGFVLDRLGTRYDLRNIVDLLRYTLPTPPVPTWMRRRMLAVGSGDPTRAVCSTLIAQAFQSIRYPILPIISRLDPDDPDCAGCIREIMHIRHHSLFAPRDFDVSPYFEVVKPSMSEDFDYRALEWDEDDST